MKKIHAVTLSVLTATAAFAADVAAIAKDFAAKATPNTITCKAENGWLYNKN